MPTPIDLYEHTNTETTEKQFIPRDEAGTGYTMKLFSMKDHENHWQCTFEVQTNRLYSQKFWKDTTKQEKLEAIMQQWITCDIEINDKGFQRIFNVDIAGETEPAPGKAQQHLDRITEPAGSDDVPF
jgi:hypothetical protein